MEVRWVEHKNELQQMHSVHGLTHCDPQEPTQPEWKWLDEQHDAYGVVGVFEGERPVAYVVLHHEGGLLAWTVLLTHDVKERREAIHASAEFVFHAQGRSFGWVKNDQLRHELYDDQPNFVVNNESGLVTWEDA